MKVETMKITTTKFSKLTQINLTSWNKQKVFHNISCFVKYLQIRRKIWVRFLCVKEWAGDGRFCKVSMRGCDRRTWQNTRSIACSLALKAGNPVGTLETWEGKAAESPGIVLARQADYGALKSLNKSRIGQPWLVGESEGSDSRLQRGLCRLRAWEQV
jgi:hypothetical protein